MYKEFVRDVLFLLSLLLLLAPLDSFGFPEPPSPSDDKLVELSDCIVIGHAKNDSIEKPILVISEILKGTPPSKEIPIIVPNWMAVEKGSGWAALTGDHDPNPGIVIAELGSMPHPICGNILHDQIWFLRTDPKGYSNEKDGHVLRIWDPADVQPVELKEYFEAFLAPHPEDTLKQLAVGDSSLALRSQTFLNHADIQRILKEPDVQIRAKLLLKYYLFTDDKKRPPDQGEAALQLWESCGQTGAALLLPYFSDPKYKAMQSDIMGLWANAQYHGGIPLLVEMLEKETRFWQNQTPDQRDLWVDIRPGHSPTNEQNSSRLRIEMILFVFRQVPDPRAKAEVEKVSPIWKQMFPGDASRSLGQTINEGLML
jgi:hypothetical protein